MMDSPIGQAGTFIIFGSINLVGAIVFYFKLKETSGGLTDKQKKNLYTPSDLVSPSGSPDNSPVTSSKHNNSGFTDD